MRKPTTLSLALDTSKIEKGHRLIDSLQKKIDTYNKSVEKSNKLLREQQRLRNELGIGFDKGKTTGLVIERNGKKNHESSN